LIKENNPADPTFESLNNFLGVTPVKRRNLELFKNENLLDFLLEDLGFSLSKTLIDFFELNFKVKLLGVTRGSLNSQEWKGISSIWQSEKQDYQIKFDRDLVFLLLSCFGLKEEKEQFSFDTLSKIEYEIIQGLFAELINKTEAISFSKSTNSSSKFFLIWFVEKESLRGKVLIEFPGGIWGDPTLAKLSSKINEPEILEEIKKEKSTLNNDFSPNKEDHISDIFSEEDSDFSLDSREQGEKLQDQESPQRKEKSLAEKIILKTNLIVGFSKMTVKEIYDLEVGDLVLLEKSERKNLYLEIKKENKLFEIPVEFPEQKKSKNIKLIKMSSDQLSSY